MGTTPQGIGAGINPGKRAQADRVTARLAKETEHIQAQKNLDRKGREARLAAARLKAEADFKRLSADETDHVTGLWDQRIRGFFGYIRPDDSRIISIRDAADRAKLVKTPNECAALMNDCEESGDEVLLRALAKECAKRHNPLEPAWGGLFRTWAEMQPDGTEALDDLAAIFAETTDVGHRLVRESAFGLPPLPKELVGYSNTQLRALAAQADTISELPPTRAEQVGTRLAGMVHAELE